MKTYYVFFLMILFFVSCSKGDDEENNDTNEDPWSNLRDLKPGEVKFEGENFCYYDCFNDEVFCGKRVIKDCDLSRLHTEYYSYDCYTIIDFGGFNSGPPEEEFGLLWIVCFCGRSGNTYSGTSTREIGFSSCDDYYNRSPRTDPYSGELWDGTCKDDCNPCQRNCQNKECGPDGCGGNCGTCPSGEKCSSAGKCISESSGDPCSECLSTCRGLPGCCTGCGCLCEDECGGCF